MLRIFFHILLFSFFIIHLGYGQCRGDINLDHTVDDEDEPDSSLYDEQPIEMESVVEVADEQSEKQ